MDDDITTTNTYRELNVYSVAFSQVSVRVELTEFDLDTLVRRVYETRESSHDSSM